MRSATWLSKEISRRGHLALVAGIGLAVISLSVLSATIYHIWPAIVVYPWCLNPVALALGFLVYSLDVGLAVVGWHLIYRALDRRHPLASGAAIYVLSAPARRLPGGLFGLAAGRIYLYRRRGFAWELTSTAIALEAAVISFSGAFLSILYLALVAARVGAGVWAVVAVGTLMGLCLHPAALRRIIAFVLARRQRLASTDMCWITGRMVASWVLTYGAVWLGGGGLLFLIVNAAAPVPLDFLPAIAGSWVVAGTVSSALYFVPSGLGVTELTLVTLLSAYVPPAQAAVAAISMRLFVTAGEVFWMVVVWAVRRRVTHRDSSTVDAPH